VEKDGVARGRDYFWEKEKPCAGSRKKKGMWKPSKGLETVDQLDRLTSNQNGGSHTRRRTIFGQEAERVLPI